MKTKEKLNAMKEKVENVSKKQDELTDEQLDNVAGGSPYSIGEKDENDPSENINWEQLIEG